MRFASKYAGKWVAIRKDRVIADEKTLNKLLSKVEEKKNREDLRFALIPKGNIAGYLKVS